MKALTYPFDPDYILKKKKALRRELLADGSERIQKKIAVLGGSTTDDIVKVLELFLLNDGIEPTFFCTEYAQYEQEALFPSEELRAFAPDLIYLHTSSRNVKNLPETTDAPEQIEEKLAAETSRWRAIWNSLGEHFACPIIQNNFEPPSYRLLGNQDCCDPRGESNFIFRLNAVLYEYARGHEAFFVHDLQYAAADFGLRQWADPYYWNLYKYCMMLKAIPAFAYSLSAVIRSLFGRNKKALILDLDNTLWGGVIGDDGVEGIELGQETGIGQAYYDFQAYVKKLSSIGVLLGISSKNDEENALAGLRHPDGALSPEDFVSVHANWEPKDKNIAEIAEEMHILPEAVVFADDNPAERDIAEAQIPGLVAPDIGTVEEYIAVLDRGAYFEVTSLSEDDARRGEMVRSNVARDAAKATYADYGEYLAALAMRSEIGDFSPVDRPRIVQLANKSNQFNLTTRRYTLPEMQEICDDTNRIRLCGRLADKFGDNGVVSVLIGRREGEVLHMELWLMSCRVLKRDMELAMLDALVARCREAEIKTIRGYYFPTKKNGMVRTLYGDLGFSKSGEDADGNTTWEMEVAGYQNQNRYIQVSMKGD